MAVTSTPPCLGFYYGWNKTSWDNNTFLVVNKNGNTVTLGFYILYVYISFQAMHVCYRSQQNLHKNNAISSWKVCAFFTVPQLYKQIRNKLACCCHLRYFQLENSEKTDCQLQFPTYYTVCMYAHYSMASRLH